MSRRQAISTAGKVAIGASIAVAAAGAGVAYFASLPPKVVTQTVTSTTTSKSTAPPGKGSIVYYTPFGTGPFGQWEINAQQAWAKVHPDQPVLITSNGDFTGQLALGVPIDLTEFNAGGAQLSWALLGQQVKWDADLYPNPYVDDMEPSVKDYFNFYGQKYSAWPVTLAPRGIVLNKNLFDAAGVTLPDSTKYPKQPTWDEIIPLLQKVNNPPSVYGMGLTGEGGAGRGEFNEIAWGFGVDILVDGTNPFTFSTDINSAGGKATFQLYYDLVNTYKVVPKSAAVGGPATDGQYAQGVYASALLGSWIWEQLAVGPASAQQIIPKTVYTLCPSDGRQNFAYLEVGSCIQMTAGLNPTGAFDWATNYLATPKNVAYLMNWPQYAVSPAGIALAKQYGIITDHLSPYHSINVSAGATTNFWQPNWLDMANNHAKRPPPGPWSKVNVLIGNHVDNVINGTETASDAAAGLESDIVTYLKSISRYSGS